MHVRIHILASRVPCVMYNVEITNPLAQLYLHPRKPKQDDCKGTIIFFVLFAASNGSASTSNGAGAESNGVVRSPRTSATTIVDEDHGILPLISRIISAINSPITSKFESSGH